MSFAKTPFDNWIRKANEQVDEREKDPNPSAGQTFLAKVVSKTYDASGNVYKFFYESPESGGKKYPAYIFKIRLEEPTGESRTGRENFYFDDSELREIAQSSEMSFEQARNYMLNNQPDGLYVDNGTGEMPGVGDPVEARSDAGIPNRYRIYAINGQQKTINGGYATPMKETGLGLPGEGIAAFGKKNGFYPDTNHMTSDQRYDYYAGEIMKNQGVVKKGTNQRNLVAFRRATLSTSTTRTGGRYDDRMAMIWIDENGLKRAEEFTANTEPSAHYLGRAGDDADSDGRLDQGRLPAGYYVYRLGTYVSEPGATPQRALRPTSDIAAERDTNHDGIFNDGQTSPSGRSLLIHKGGNWKTYSAGCQTLPPAEFASFWNSLVSQGDPGDVGYTVINLKKGFKFPKELEGSSMAALEDLDGSTGA